MKSCDVGVSDQVCVLTYGHLDTPGMERQIAVGMDLDRTDGATAQQQQQQQWRVQHLLWIYDVASLRLSGN